MPTSFSKQTAPRLARQFLHGMTTQAILLLAALATSALATCHAIANDSAPRPNVILIMADDLGWADVAFHGGSAPTPNLDKLAAESLELTQHYVAPVCSPTRTGLMTGRFWSRFGVTSAQNERALPWDTVTLPRALQQAGYETCLTGKWHLGSNPAWGPNHFGFDHSYGSLAGGVGPWNHFYKQGPFSNTWHRNEQLLEESGHVTDLIAHEAVQWIAQRSDRPFFLYVPFTAVHLPVREPPEWLARVPRGIEGEVARHYAACVMHLDDAVSRILAALDEAGQRQSTLVIFTSDNGGSTAENHDPRYPADDYPTGKLPGNNLPLRGQKGQLYEGGIHVPTMVSWPGQLKAGECSAPLHITDWMPTICGLAGYEPKQNLKWDGQDIWKVLIGEATLPPRPLYWVAPQSRSSALRVGDWKLIQRREAGRDQFELYHLANDPGETTDLSELQPGKTHELQDQLAAMARQDRDAVASD